jgi:hypothetical protein
MTRKIRSISTPARKIVSTSEPQRRIDPAQVAKALGAEEAHKPGGARLSGSPPSLFALRQELYRRLRSTGGRRSLEGAGERHKIPLIEGDWERLQEVARASESETVRPSPAQVASLLLHRALKELKQDVNSER